MPDYSKRPERGTEAYEWWRVGAKAEAALFRKGMTRDGEELWEVVTVMAQQGRSRIRMLRWLLRVYCLDELSYRQIVRLFGGVIKSKIKNRGTHAV